MIRDARGNTLLHWAAEANHVELVRLLLEGKGSETGIASANHSGMTPFSVALEMRHFEIVRLFCVLARDCNGSTPLHRAAAMGNPRAVRALIAAGADVNAMDCVGETPLHDSMLVASPSEVEARVEIVWMLLRACARADVKNHLGKTPLDCAEETRRSLVAI